MRDLEQIDRELSAIHANREAARAAEAAEAERKADAERDAQRVHDDFVELIASMRESIGHDLECPADAANEALLAKRAAATGETKRLFASLLRLWHSIRPRGFAGGPNADAARESRHALAALGVLPAVRKDDAAFGTERSLRELPKMALDRNGVGAIVSHSVSSEYAALCAAFGVAVARELPPAVESPQDARKRLGPAPLTLGAMASLSGDPEPKWDRRGRARRGIYTRPDAQGSQPDALDPREAHRRELALVEERWELALRARREEHVRALVAQRVEIVAAIDRALVDLPMGEGWFWARYLRRIAALEPQVRITDDNELFDLPIDKVFNLARSNGARFNLTPYKK